MDNKSKSSRMARAFVLIGGAFFAGVFILGAAGTIMTNSDLFNIALNQLPATVGLPFSALGSLWLVMFLESTSGPMEFETLGFKFKGSSGPVVLWVMSFLSMTLAIKILWIPA